MTEAGRGRVRILWTTTARACLRALPTKVRRGLLEKADELYECDDPRRVHKPLVGPLAGCYRITYGRYRAVYTVEEGAMKGGKSEVVVTIIFIAAGIRRERSRDDVYRVAKKIVELGLIEIDDEGEAGGN
ncbi:MAG: hypothetical protein KIS87_06280 [Phycisphaeraceae bacterium]|nr:hypothetical protein [Phycisphaeraceae bacterium]